VQTWKISSANPAERLTFTFTLRHFPPWVSFPEAHKTSQAASPLAAKLAG
jgi:hypothetical protein